MKKKYFLTSLCLLIIFYFLINSLSNSGKLSIVSNILTQKQIQNIKKYIFPYKFIAQQQKEISELEQFISPLELEVIFRSLPDIFLKKTDDIKLSNNLVLNKFKLVNGFYFGINLEYSGSGYIDFHDNNLIVLSVRGVLGYSNDFTKKLKFKQIKNNIDEFISLEQFKKSHKFSLKDLLINNNVIYISYTEEIKENCWNTSLIYADFNYQNIEFKKMFSSEKCIDSKNNKDNEFEPLQSGGRIINFDKDNILLSIGDYRNRFLAQDKKSVNGKIIKIDKSNLNYEIYTMGHRNPQGLYYDNKNNFILETEHGPDGGDEINLIEVYKTDEKDPPNYGWAISSAGEHYGGKDKIENKAKYKKYPLYKSHSEHGFIEPLKSFVPSIGISEILQIGENNYVVSSLKDQSLYFFELRNNKILNLKRVIIGERIRDLIFKNNKLYLFLESSASLGVIEM